MRRVLDWAACWNVRDLGGYRRAMGGETRWKRVVRAGNLSRLTEAGRDALLSYGIRTVIDVRDPREFEIDLDPFHERGPWAGQVTYVNEPLISEAEWEAIRDPEVMKKGHTVTLELSKLNIARVLAAIARASPGGTVVHCHAGKERTGVVSALLLALAGVPDEVIADDYVASDAHLQHLYQQWAARAEDASERSRLLRGFQSELAHMLEPLAYVRTFGGIDAYLLHAGVSADALNALRSRLLDPMRES